MTRDVLRCRHCCEVIGAYEPMVVVLGEQPVHTSRTVAEAEQLTGEPCFHACCFAEQHGGVAAEDGGQ